MEYIRSDERLEALAVQLSGAALLAIDTEAAGYHRYHDRICLFQVSTRTDTWVIDTLAVSDIAPLTPLLASDAVEVVLHDADYDLRLLARDYGVRVTHLFDTKLAAQILGEPQIGLASLLEKHLGVKLDKKHQRADWAQRPLPDDMIAYAAEDTKHLPRLRDVLRRLLEQTGRLHWAEEEFRIRVQVDAASTGSDPDAWLRLKNTRDLKPRQLAALRELYAWREGVARSRDLAPFRVLTNDVLVELARRMPRSRAELAGVPGAPRTLADRYGAELLDALERARGIAESELPVRPRGPKRPPPDPEFDELVERLRQVRDEAAQGLGLDRGFLMPRSQLEELARRRPNSISELEAIPGFRRWQAEAVGGELITTLRSWRR